MMGCVLLARWWLLATQLPKEHAADDFASRYVPLTTDLARAYEQYEVDTGRDEHRITNWFMPSHPSWQERLNRQNPTEKAL